jgi:hypothetical protein
MAVAAPARSPTASTSSAAHGAHASKVPVPAARRAPWMPAPNPWVVADWPWTGSQTLMFVDGGAALLGSDGSSLTLVDPRRRVVVDTVALRSATVPDRSGTPGSEPKLAQDLPDARWAWDAARHTVVAAGCLSGSGEIAGGLSVWTPGLQPLPVPLIGADKRAECRPLAITADGALILARTAATSVQLFAAATASPTGAPILLAHDPVIGSAAIGGAWIATGDDTGNVELYEAASGRRETLARDRNHQIRGLIFDPTRAVLIVLGDVETVAWDLPARTPTHLTGGSDVAAFSLDGKRLALAAADKISILDGATLQLTRSLEITTSIGIQALALSPDAALLAVISAQDREIRELAAVGPPATLDRRWFDQLRPLPVPGPPPEPAFTRDGIVEGRVTQAGRPVAGAEIWLVPNEQEWPHARALAAITRRTGADGAFRITGVPRIDWRGGVTAPGRTAGGWIAELRKQPKQTANAKLEPAVTIQGLVLGPDGRPAANVHVFHGSSRDAPEVALTTASDGTFTIDHLRRDTDSSYGPGYELQAWRSDGAVVTTRTPLKAVGPIKITLRLRAPDDPHVVRLQLVDETGAPVPNASVELGHAVKHPGDARGMFSSDVEPRIDQGNRVDVQATVDGYVRDQQIAWPAHGVVTVAIRLAPPPGALLPLVCTIYQRAIERLAHCDRVPQATRAALASELARAAKTWAAHPETAELACSLNQYVATENARMCH